MFIWKNKNYYPRIVIKYFCWPVIYVVLPEYDQNLHYLHMPLMPLLETMKSKKKGPLK